MYYRSEKLFRYLGGEKMTLLKERVKNKGITQQKIADIAGVTDAHINYILNGKRDISYSLAKRIYKELGYNSPLSVIFEYYGFEDDEELKKFKEAKVKIKNNKIKVNRDKIKLKDSKDILNKLKKKRNNRKNKNSNSQ